MVISQRQPAPHSNHRMERIGLSMADMPRHNLPVAARGSNGWRGKTMAAPIWVFPSPWDNPFLNRPMIPQKLQPNKEAVANGRLNLKNRVVRLVDEGLFRS